MATEISPSPEPVPARPSRRSGSWHSAVLGWFMRHWASMLLGGLIGAGAAFVWIQHGVDDRLARSQAQLVSLNQKLESQLLGLREQAENLQGQLLIEQGTRQGLELALKAAQDELAEVREKVAFFDQLLPPGPGGAISVRGLDITRQDAILFYRVLMTRLASSGEVPFNGRLAFEARGMRDGQPVDLPLQFVTDQQATDTRDVSFEWFLRQEGYLKLPDNFEPSQLVMRLYEGKVLRLSHTVDLPLSP